MVNELDSIRKAKGNQELKTFFSKMVDVDREKAISLINDENMGFGSLYVLKTEIEAAGLAGHLSVRNEISLYIINEVLAGTTNLSTCGCSTCDYVVAVHSALKWIFSTGAADDGMDDEYDMIMDAAAALLIKVYSDRTILVVMADMIFSRNRTGLFFNDLVWVFFEAQSPGSLRLIANRLESMYPEDIELAYKLLCFIPDVRINKNNGKKKQYLAFLDWINKNTMFLCYTGEGFHQSVNPAPYRVVLEAKYLCKAAAVDTGSIIEPLTEYELKLLDNFSGLGIDTKVMLSDYSYMLHKGNAEWWEYWKLYPVGKQIKLAARGMKGKYD